MPNIDLEKLARELTSAQIRQLAQIVESAPELARLKARREEILASIKRVEGEIAKIVDSASEPSKTIKAAKQGNPRRIHRPSPDADAERPESEAPASIPIPEPSPKGDAPTDDSATTTQLPALEKAEMIAETEAAGEGTMVAAPRATVDDPATEAQPSAPDLEATAKMETVADGPVPGVPCGSTDISATAKQPSVPEETATI